MSFSERPWFQAQAANHNTLISQTGLVLSSACTGQPVGSREKKHKKEESLQRPNTNSAPEPCTALVESSQYPWLCQLFIKETRVGPATFIVQSQKLINRLFCAKGFPLHWRESSHSIFFGQTAVGNRMCTFAALFCSIYKVIKFDPVTLNRLRSEEKRRQKLLKMQTNNSRGTKTKSLPMHSVQIWGLVLSCFVA